MSYDEHRTWSSNDSFNLTSVIDDSEFPMWEEIVDIDLHDHSLKLDDISFHMLLMDSDPVLFFSDDALGEVIVPVSDIWEPENVILKGETNDESYLNSDLNIGKLFYGWSSKQGRPLDF